MMVVYGFSHTFSIIAKAHLGLAKANGVFALADSIELFEFGLVDTLYLSHRHHPLSVTISACLFPVC